jgi:phosphoglycerol transferase MdoB-like AlkP superfamily enzyme
MIDWFNLATNALWILACAMALATLSYASWQASLRRERLRIILTAAPYQISIDLAGVLFCLGLAGTSGKGWEIVLWLILSVLFAAQGVYEMMRKRK